MSPRTLAAALMVVALPQLAGARLRAQTVAVTDATVFPVAGPRIEHATVLWRDGKIVAVGAGVAVPAGSTRIDAAGRWVTPGFIQTGSSLGLKLFESGGLLQTDEDSTAGDVKAAFNVADGIDPAAITIPVARLEGVTGTLAVPAGGLIAGRGAFFDLAGDRLEDLLVRSPAAMVMNLGQGGKAGGSGSRAGAVQRLRRILRDAGEYARRKDDYRRRRIQPLAAPAADLEALEPVLRGELPVLAIANRRSDIEAALRLAREFHLRLVIWGGAEAWKAAAELAAARVPVVVEPLTDIPKFDALGARLDNATLLDRAGVAVILAQHDMAHFRDLRQAAGNAVANGLPWKAVLRAVTLGPAEAFGVADRYGSLEPGKVANLVVWSGDPFEFSSDAEHVFIRGREVSRESRQTELLERYRVLPPRY
jgi:imidazolonepropionase-like amidohydrolase